MTDGYHVHEVNPFYTQARNEHRELHGAVESIRRLLDETNAADVTAAQVNEAAAAIIALRERLSQHFQQEEEGGYLEEAIVRVPTLAPQASQLQKQHGEFLVTADAMLAHARGSAPPTSIWRELKTDYERFAKRLQAHEAAEDALLGRAFNESAEYDN